MTYHRPLTLAMLVLSATLPLGAHAADGMKPGLWEITSDMSGSGMPAMPKISDAQRKQMEAAGVKMPAMGGQGMSMSHKICVTPEQAKKGTPPEDPKQKCEQTDIKTSGKTTSWKVSCSGQQKMTGTGSITYESPERYSGETAMQMQGGPQGAMAMQMKFKGQWLSADCK
ncbi:MAG: DUF3617 domain-containing protein [Rhodocyclaceae bacterium]|nr:MAG: DUF3617 domain-containing protein [Rhodocyclaceae bacterium]